MIASFIIKKGTSYKHSLELNDIITDFDENDAIKDVEILKASKKLGIPKQPYLIRLRT